MDDDMAKQTSAEDKQADNRFFRPTVPTLQSDQEKPKEAAKGLDLNQPGDINGVPVMQFDTGSVVDKPWLRPGSCLLLFEYSLILGNNVISK